MARGEAQHTEKAGLIVETHIIWHAPLIGPQRMEFEKALERLGVEIFRVPKDEKTTGCHHGFGSH